MGINGQEGLQNLENKSNNYWSLLSSQPLILKAGRHLLTLVFLGLAVHLILPQITSFEGSLQVIRTMTLWAVLLAGLAEIISYIGYSYLINSVLSIANQHIPILKGAAITLAASSMGMLAGGTLGNAAATYSWVRKAGVSKEASGLAGTLPTMFNNAVLILLATAGTVHLLLVHELSSVQFYAFLLILTLLSLGTLAVSWGRKHRTRFNAGAGKIAAFFARIRNKPYNPVPIENFVSRLFAALDVLHKGGWQRPALAAAFSISLDMLTLYLFFIAAGHPIKPSILLVGYGLPLLFGKMTFLIPGGVGIVESTMAALYTGLGVPGPIAVVVILSYRMFSFWIPTLIGFPVAFYLQKESR
ncbi:hypothetical protein MSHOH_1521 [Methanosarcina horonobensis HB-1 = JCM 15518]|uniref:Integral membrane protein n=1 Tax=Methanosarcina horonobensis HB-1 = JCM 15518 TaxID=1434110 RepID=A0A0E3S914_9EURY|nr:YbhN family protein [Methanosarcina horonobensis]AKB78004.1 hypothetical protein MSHOH_1521 [Methanosarcina horonobensis HB-1 = JCM 15518]